MIFLNISTYVNQNSKLKRGGFYSKIINLYCNKIISIDTKNLMDSKILCSSIPISKFQKSDLECVHSLGIQIG